MKRNKITAVILSIVMSMSMMMPSFEVMADETSAPSETQKTESSEEKEPKTTEKQVPKETEKQEPKETEKQEPKETEKQEPKETEKQESKETEKQEPKETEKQEPKETEKQEPKETEKQEPKETEKQEPEETEKQEPEETEKQEPKETEEQESDQTQGSEPETTETLPEIKAKRKATNGYSGKINSRLSWSLDDEGTLTITGSGDMPNYREEFSYSSNVVPWKDYLSDIKAVVIMDGVTSVGNGSFLECNNLCSVSLSNSIKTIGIYAFYNCSSLSNVTIPSGVTSIGSYAFSGCKCFTRIIIPDSVTTLGRSAFFGCEGVTSISISTNVQSIPPYCFTNCYGLTSVEIPQSAKFIGEGAFHTCKNLKTITLYDGLTTIYASAFYNCPNLNSITIPDTVTKIGEQAFVLCKGLKRITIPSSVTSIENLAFERCSGLTKVVISEGVVSIGNSAFANCSALESVAISSLIANRSAAFPNVSENVFHYYYDLAYSSNNGGTITGKTRTFGTDEIELSVSPKGNFTLNKLTWTSSGKTVELFPNENGKYIMPDANESAVLEAYFSILGICGENLKWCFSVDGDLTITGSGDMFNWENYSQVPWNDIRNEISSVVISDSATSIGKYAFQSCTKLKQVIIPDGVTSIGSDAFKDCTNLKSIVLNRNAYKSEAFPNFSTNVFHYYYDVLYNEYDNNEFVTVSGKTRSFGTDVLEITINCNKYRVADNVYLSFSNNSCDLTRKTNDKWECVMPDSDTAATLRITLLAACGENMTWAMDNSNGTSVLKISGSGKMYDWLNDNDAPWSEYKEVITNISFPEDISYIGKYSFQNFSALTKIIVPDNVTSIGNNAFKNCSRLESVVLNRDVDKAIAFPGFPSGVFHYYFNIEYSNYGYGAVSGKNRVYGTEEIKLNISHEDNYAVLYMKLFGWKYDPEEDNDVSYELANYSFDSYDNCIITMPDSDSDVYLETFFKYNGAQNTCGAHLTWTLDENGTLTISGYGDMANFIGSGYADPGSEQDDRPWKNNRYNVKSIVFNGNVTSIGNGAFEDFKNLETVSMPASLKTIGEKAFVSCESLKSITIPDNVTSIGDEAFAKCKSITSITLPSKITYISNNMFSGCEKLTDFTFLGTITKIGNFAFSENPSLTSFTIPSTVTEIGDGLFFECTGLKSINIHNKVISIGGGAFWGCTSMENITIPDSVTSMGDGVFFECSNLKTITLPARMTAIGNEAFARCTGLTDFTVPENVTHIGSEAFKECDNIERVKLPDRTVDLGEDVFVDNTKLNTVILNKSSYNQSAFNGCSANIYFYYDVTYSNDGHGTVSGNQRSYGTDEMQFTVNPENGYTVDKILLVYAGNTIELTTDKNNNATNGSKFVQNKVSLIRANGIVSINSDDTGISYTYTMPDAANGAEIKATFKKIGYSVTVGTTVNGSAKVDKGTATVGEVVTITPEPAKGYEVDTIKVNDTINDGTTFTMPAGNVTVTVTFKKTTYNVNVSDSVNGSAGTDKSTAVIDDVVKVTVTPDVGYELDEIKVNDSVITGEEFTMGAGDATVTVTFKKIQYTITVSQTTNGTATVSKDKAGIGDEITILATPDKGYYLSKVTVNGVIKEGTTFTMPADNVTIELEFSEQFNNTLTVKGGKTAKVKYKKLRKKAQTVARAKVMSVSNAQGNVKYSLVAVKRGKSKKYKKYFKINATTGNVTVKKKLKKGTYTITCRVTASGDFEHKGVTKTVSFKIKVK